MAKQIFIQLSELTQEPELALRHVNMRLEAAGFNMNQPIEIFDDIDRMGKIYKQLDVPTNRDHFFGVERLPDTIALLTYEDHPRLDCRLFKKTLRMMSPNNMEIWLNSPVDTRFNW